MNVKSLERKIILSQLQIATAHYSHKTGWENALLIHTFLQKCIQLVK